MGRENEICGGEGTVGERVESGVGEAGESSSQRAGRMRRAVSSLSVRSEEVRDRNMRGTVRR